ncbi:asparagine synthase-related protein [Rhodohalobacter sp. 8-1]|uniref:asparagine synthase-related protein n=1 Tax=Rhodohalobacter sp. 8-1 TaxID=3131972 RepID=UPI0030EC4B88
MSGIYGFYSTSPLDYRHNYNRFFSADLSQTQNEEFISNNFIYGRSVLKKFAKDRFLYEEEDLIIGIEGIVYSYQNPQEEIVSAYKKSGLSFIKDLDGNYSGFIFDKSENKIHLFTDVMATRSIFYYSNPDLGAFFFSSELKVLSSLLNDLNITYTPDRDGFNCLLSFGYMLDDITLIEDVKRLSQATILTCDLNDGKISQQKYFDFDTTEEQISLDVAISRLDSLITQSIAREWEKDRSETQLFLSFISGGLDARVNLFIAKELGFTDISALNFSQTGAPDHLIAKEIADGESLDYQFFPLDGGQYFINSFEELVAANDGMVTVSGASHMYQALKSLPLEKYGAIHSGQIGDVLFGSYTRPAFNMRNNIGKMGSVNAPDILSQISVLPNIIDKYKDSTELFSYEQRQVNGTINGDRMCSHLIDLQSPFYNKELISFCLSLPMEFKLNKKLYMEWIRRKHPKMFEYRWDSAGIVPRNRILTKIAIQVSRLNKHFSRLILGKDSSPMNPFDFWMESNDQFTLEINNVFRYNLEYVSEPWLKTNASNVFTNFKSRGKFTAITAVLAYKLHFSKG